MEELGILFGIAAVAVIIILPIWLVANVLRLRRQAEEERQENTQHWRDLTARLHILETQFKEWKQTTGTKEVARETVSPAVSVPVAGVHREAAPQPSPVPPKPDPRPVTPATPPPAVSAAHTPQPEPTLPALARPPVPPPAPPRPSIPPPVLPRIHPPAPEPARSGFDLEEMLGTNWLNKIGIGILVLGLAFFLAYQLQNLGPAGKVLLGIALSGAMIAAGIRYESNERYRILARAGAAGGWSLLYFVSYAVYHVPAARVIDSRQIDFFLMLTVAAAIVGYSLRYRSQATTALALVLSYLTVGIHHTSFYSLAASVILALTVVTLALRMQWFALEMFGIIATYFNHLLWLWPVIEAMDPHRTEFPEFHTSVALLAFYWLLFRFSYIYRNPANRQQEELSTAAALLNGFCLLGLLRYQSIHPEWAFWALLVLGTVELVLSALAARRRRTAFVVLATLGSALLVAAIPFRYSGSNLSLLWLVAAETFLLAGVFTSEIVFRRIGMITLAIVAGQMIVDTAGPLLELRLGNAAGVPPAYPTAVLFAMGAAIFYLNAHWVRERWAELFDQEFDWPLIASMTYVGGLLALLALWLAFPGMWTAVTWALLALLLDVAGKQLRQPPLAVQGNVIAVLAIVRLVTLNLFSAEPWHGVSFRFVTVGLTALLLYAAAPFARAADDEGESEWALFTAGYTWAASILLGLLVWYEVSEVNVALAWAALGIVLLEIGLRLNAGFLRWQGYTALSASFVGLLVINFTAPAAPTPISPRVWRALTLTAAYYYADVRLQRSAISRRNRALHRAGSLFAYCGTLALSGWLFVELQPPWVAASWAALAFATLAVASRQLRHDFLHQAFLLVLAVVFRMLTYNFFQSDPVDVSFWRSQQYYSGVAIALLFAALPLAFALRRSRLGATSGFVLDAYPEQVFFFVPFGLLTALVALESSRGQLTVAWGVEGLATFLFALWVGERSFRLAGLGLLLVCVAKIFLVDVWGLDPQSRYITLIVLGAALVLVSFLYTRHKEKFRQYL